MSPITEGQRRCLELSWHQRKLLSNLCANLFKSTNLCKVVSVENFRIALLDTRGYLQGIKVAMVEPEIISLAPLTISHYSYNKHKIVTRTFTDHNKDLILTNIL